MPGATGREMDKVGCGLRLFERLGYPVAPVFHGADLRVRHLAEEDLSDFPGVGHHRLFSQRATSVGDGGYHTAPVNGANTTMYQFMAFKATDFPGHMRWRRRKCGS